MKKESRRQYLGERPVEIFSCDEQVGCKNVHIHCEATDVAYVMEQYAKGYTDGGVNLVSANDCLKQKCELKDGKYINKA